MIINYQAKIEEYTSHEQLLELWKQSEQGVTSEWEPGKALEYLILQAFQLEGAEVRFPYYVSTNGVIIEQIDGVIYTNGLSCLIECKDVVERVNIEPVAKLRNQLLRRPETTFGVVFSRSGFTEPTIALERSSTSRKILLWNGDEILYALQNSYMCQGLLAKYRYCVEYGLPDGNIIYI
jgi:hypothetical protein